MNLISYVDMPWVVYVLRLRSKCDDTRAETRFRLSAKRTSPFKSAGASVQSTTGSRGVRISGSTAGYMFRGSAKGTGYPLHSSVSPSLPLPCVNRLPSHFSWTIPLALASRFPYLDQHIAVSPKRLPSLQPFCHLLQTFRNPSLTPHCVTCSWLVIKYVSPSFPLS